MADSRFAQDPRNRTGTTSPLEEQAERRLIGYSLCFCVFNIPYSRKGSGLTGIETWGRTIRSAVGLARWFNPDNCIY